MTLKLLIESIKENNNQFEFISSKYDENTKSNLQFKITTNKKNIENINEIIGKTLIFDNLIMGNIDDYINFNRKFPKDI